MQTAPVLPTKPPTARVRIWDRPTRLFHWLIVVLIALAWWTADNGQMLWHKRLGYIIAGLLLFRLYWGIVGGSTARFSHFLRGPGAVSRYAVGLFRGPSNVGLPGHNPMGGWSVAALLAVMGAVVGFGLFTVDVDGEESGPFADRISFDAGRLAGHWHHLLFNGLLVLIAVHLLAIAFYAVVKRHNLVGAMITGKGQAAEGSEPLRPVAIWRLGLGAALAMLFAAALARGFKV